MPATSLTNTKKYLKIFSDVYFCTESKSADRLQNEPYRSTGQEEYRDQQGVRTVRTETLRNSQRLNGKALFVTTGMRTW